MGEAALEVSFGDGERGRAVAWDGNHMIAVGPRAYAPGRPLQLTLCFADGAAEVRGKTIGSKRRDADGHFDVRIRLVDLRREDRARLVAALEG